MVFIYVNIFKKSKETAFALFMDMDRRAEFVDIYNECTWINKTDEIVGSVINDKLVFLGLPLNIHSDVTHYEENALLTTKSTAPPLHPILTIKVWDEPNGGCSAYLHIEIKLGPFERMPKFLFKKVVDAIVDRLVKNYRKVLD